MGPAIDQLPRTIVARDLGHRVVGLVGVALQEAAPVSAKELQRMFFPPAGGVMEQHDGWASTAMPAIIGDDGPEEAALGAFHARFQHRRAGFSYEDAACATKMDPDMVDDGHQVETGGPDLVAECAAGQIDPLPLEDLGLPIKRQVVTELRDDNPG